MIKIIKIIEILGIKLDYRKLITILLSKVLYKILMQQLNKNQQIIIIIQKNLQKNILNE